MKHKLLRMGLRTSPHCKTKGISREADMIFPPGMLRVGILGGLLLSLSLNAAFFWFATTVWLDNLDLRLALNAFDNAKTETIKLQGEINEPDHGSTEVGAARGIPRH